MKKILGITSIRSDYDLMSGLYTLLNKNKKIDFRLLVTGAHLSSTYGYSIESIKKDHFKILHSIESLIDSNSVRSRLKTASIFLQNAIDIVADFNPDLIIYAGDREDVIMGALLGCYLHIPTAHFFGGDHVKDTNIDNPVRHAASKLSTVHFVSTAQHKERLIKMGEPAFRIYNVGNVALDKFVNFKPFSVSEIKSYFGIKRGFEKHAIVIFHPLVKELKRNHLYFESILKVLISKNIYAFIGYPNTDPGNKDIIRICDKYSNIPLFRFYKSLERDMFLSIYKTAWFQIGNSSSGIAESASIPISVVNVGLRQVGRLSNANVVFCGTNQNEISTAVDKAISPGFLNKIKGISNVYGDGKSCMKAYNIITKTDFGKILLKTEDPLEMNLPAKK